MQPVRRLTHGFEEATRSPPLAGRELHAARVPGAQEIHVPPADDRRGEVHERGRQIDVPGQLMSPAIDLTELVGAHSSRK